MPRLRNRAGVVVNVSDEKAATLVGFTSLDRPKPKHATKKSEDE